MKAKQRVWLFIGMLLHAAAWGQQEYTVVIQKDIAGYLRVETAGGGEIRTDLSYRDNGRGPDIREAFAVDASGVPTRYAAEGRSTFGAEIRESFAVERGRLRWQSRVDQG